MSTTPTTPLRIGYVVNQYPKVSHTFIRREIIALEEQGCEVTRIAFRGWDDASVSYEQDIHERSKTTYTLKGGVGKLILSFLQEFFCQPSTTTRSLVKALQFSNGSKRSILHHLAYLLHACKILQICRDQNIGHLHAHFATNSTEVACLVKSLGGPSYSFTVHGPEEFFDLRDTQFSKKVSSASFVIAISNFCRSQLFMALPFAQWPKVKIVRCGLEESFFEEFAPTPPVEKRLLCIGRLTEQKGHAVLVDAFALALEKIPELKLTLAGDGELRRELESRIEGLGIDKSVEITGWVDPIEVEELISSSMCVVQPSFSEGLPVVLMEALAKGRVVISTYIAGIPELIDSDCGWLVPASSIVDLQRAILEAVSKSQVDLVKMGQAGLDRVKSMHSIDIETKKLKSFFEDVL